MLRGKKWALTFLSLTMAAAAAVGLIACGDDSADDGTIGDDGSGSAGAEHEHTYAETWTYNETYHWHQANCEHTDLLRDRERHTFDGFEPACTVCGYERGFDDIYQIYVGGSDYKGDKEDIFGDYLIATASALSAKNQWDRLADLGLKLVYDAEKKIFTTEYSYPLQVNDIARVVSVSNRYMYPSAQADRLRDYMIRVEGNYYITWDPVTKSTKAVRDYGDHEHAYETWAFTETEHYKTCADDGEIDEETRAPHSPDSVSGQCECGWYDPEKCQHNYQYNYDFYTCPYSGSKLVKVCTKCKSELEVPIARTENKTGYIAFDSETSFPYSDENVYYAKHMMGVTMKITEPGTYTWTFGEYVYKYKPGALVLGAIGINLYGQEQRDSFIGKTLSWTPSPFGISSYKDADGHMHYADPFKPTDTDFRTEFISGSNLGGDGYTREYHDLWCYSVAAGGWINSDTFSDWYGRMTINGKSAMEYYREKAPSASSFAGTDKELVSFSIRVTQEDLDKVKMYSHTPGKLEWSRDGEGDEKNPKAIWVYLAAAYETNSQDTYDAELWSGWTFKVSKSNPEPCRHTHGFVGVKDQLDQAVKAVDKVHGVPLPTAKICPDCHEAQIIKTERKSLTTRGVITATLDTHYLLNNPGYMGFSITEPGTYNFVREALYESEPTVQGQNGATKTETPYRTIEQIGIISGAEATPAKAKATAQYIWTYSGTTMQWSENTDLINKWKSKVKVGKDVSSLATIADGATYTKEQICENGGWDVFQITVDATDLQDGPVCVALLLSHPSKEATNVTGSAGTYFHIVTLSKVEA